MGQDLHVANFQTDIGGKKTDLFFLENRHGVRAAITNYGARLVALWLPDANGTPDNIVAGYESIGGYLNHDEAYLGATVGRFANRIAHASFQLNGVTYRVTANEGDHHIHGGHKAFHNSVWEAMQSSADTLTLKLESPAGAEGFPGKLNTMLTYSFNDEEELVMEIQVTTEEATVVNITNHSYFNLGGENNDRSARKHSLLINADHFLPVTAQKIPKGPLKSVNNTPFDFREFKRIQEGIEEGHEQFEVTDGFDHNYVLNKPAGNELTLAAKIQEPTSGRAMELLTTEPGLQFFECEFSEEMNLNHKTAFCLEPQHFPDSPNRPQYPSTELLPGDVFFSKSIYRFSAGTAGKG